MTNHERAQQLFSEALGIAEDMRRALGQGRWNLAVIRQRHLQADPAFLDWLSRLSNRLATIRGPAFYHEIEIGEAEARSAVDAANRVLAFGRDFFERLRAGQ